MYYTPVIVESNWLLVIVRIHSCEKDCTIAEVDPIQPARSSWVGKGLFDFSTPQDPIQPLLCCVVVEERGVWCLQHILSNWGNSKSQGVTCFMLFNVQCVYTLFYIFDLKHQPWISRKSETSSKQNALKVLIKSCWYAGNTCFKAFTCCCCISPPLLSQVTLLRQAVGNKMAWVWVFHHALHWEY